MTFLIQSLGGYIGNNSALDLYGRLVFSLFAFVIVIVFAYLFTKWFASYKYIRKSNGNVEILESVPVAHQNSLSLIKVGEKYILIGVTKDKISFITEVDKASIKEYENGFQQIPFENIFNKFLKK